MKIEGLPVDGVSTMMPVPAWMGSVKVSSMFVEAATLIAPKPGLYVDKLGGTVSATVKLYVAPLRPRNDMFDASLNTPCAMVTV